MSASFDENSGIVLKNYETIFLWEFADNPQHWVLSMYTKTRDFICFHNFTFSIIYLPSDVIVYFHYYVCYFLF